MPNGSWPQQARGRAGCCGLLTCCVRATRSALVFQPLAGLHCDSQPAKSTIAADPSRGHCLDWPPASGYAPLQALVWELPFLPPGPNRLSFSPKR